MIPVQVPQVGLPEEPIVVSAWLVQKGEEVIEGDRVVELLTGEITFDVAAPASGKLSAQLCDVDDTVKPGEAVAWIEAKS